MKNWFRKDIRKIVIAVVVIISIAGVSIKSMEIDGEEVEMNVTQGLVNTKEVSINTKVPGRIVEFYVEEGQDVKAGDPLVKISSEEIEAKQLQLLAQVEQAEAGVDAAEAVVAMAESNYNLALERVEQAKAGIAASQSQKEMAQAVNTKAINGARTQEVAQAEAASLLWQSTYDRAVVLYEGGAISTQKLEEIKTQMEVANLTYSIAVEGARTEDKAAAQAQVDLASAGVTSSNSVYNQALEASNIAMSQVTQAQAGLVASQGLLSQAQAGLLEVEVYLNDTLITAPIDGTVTTLNSDEGELVSTGTSIGTVSDIKDCWVTIDVDEDELAGIQEGQKIDVTFVAYEGETFTGRVATVNQQPDFAIKKATNENGNFDIVSFGVKIKLDNNDQKIHPGLTALVDLDSIVNETASVPSEETVATSDSEEANSTAKDAN